MTIGPVVLRSIAPHIHDLGGRIDCHLMVDDPAHHFQELAESGADSVTFHVEAVDDVGAVLAQAREHGLEAGIAFNPETPVEVAAEAANQGADLCLCMSIKPGLLRPGVHGGRVRADRAARASSSTASSRSTAASSRRTSAPRTTPGRTCSSSAPASSASRICRGPTGGWYKRWHEP